MEIVHCVFLEVLLKNTSQLDNFWKPKGKDNKYGAIAIFEEFQKSPL